MGWQRGNNTAVNSTTPKSGTTMLAIWDPGAGDDLGVTWVREAQKNKNAPTSTLLKGYTEHVVVQ